MVNHHELLVQHRTNVISSQKTQLSSPHCQYRVSSFSASHIMAGLIPLMLKPTSVSGTRTSMVFPAPPKNTHKRAASDITYSSQPSRPKTMRRQSQPTPASLPVLPYTPEEWRKAIVEIKHQHMTRRYRACSTRCNEILSNVKDTVSILPSPLGCNVRY